MKAAKSSRPVGTTYNRLMRDWLRENGLDGVTAQERYRLLKIMENLTEVGTWHASLDDAQRRRLNHPNAIWSHWCRRKQEAERAAPTCKNFVKATMPSHKDGKAVYWPQDVLRRAAMALRECSSSDIFTAARAVLEAAIRSESDLIRLLSPDTAAMSASPRRPDIVGVANHVG
jgi:hypothetical protein